MNAAIAINVEDSSSLKWGLSYPVHPEGRWSPTAAVRLRGKTDLPAWADPVVSRLEALAALPTVDPRGSRPMNVDDLMDALRFLIRVMRTDTAVPWIGRLNTGGLQVTWRGEGVEVEAVFDRARDERCVMVVVGENEWDASPEAADSLFASVVDRLTRSGFEHTAILRATSGRR